MIKRLAQWWRRVWNGEDVRVARHEAETERQRLEETIITTKTKIEGRKESKTQGK